ncbi:Cloroperoxidase [Periconia macrospinosa]|uniref:Cloroperoxidase n=1 Tax=Periconia macrospinosa TaxID=97972 RepID=A0A2V1DW64_9PLEO|nr:Cloroperoxidase [Periconia macrospinosa]
MKIYAPLSFAANAFAFASYSEIRPYVPPTGSDSRSPCPGLNVLANHGYLPHNGLSISGPQIVEAFSNAMNFDTAVSQGAVDFIFGALSLNTTTAHIDLEQLFVPNVTDAKTSVARDDYKHPINPGRIAFALEASGPQSDVTPTTWGKTRIALEDLDKGQPLYSLDITGGAGTGALMFLSVSQDPKNNGNYANVTARKDFVRVFYQEERLPVELGWKRRSIMPSAADLTGITTAILEARNSGAGSK